jgi:hypothetical protein
MLYKHKATPTEGKREADTLASELE